MSFNANYKDFDLSVLLQGQAGNEIYNAAKYYLMRFDGRNNVRTDYLNDYWKGENTSNIQPAVTTDIFNESIIPEKATQNQGIQTLGYDQQKTH